MESQEVAGLLRRLEEAFGDLPKPVESELVFDNSGYHLECNQVKKMFGGRHWNSFSVQEIQFESDALSFFSPQGFRFYLPAFIRAAVLAYEEADLIPVAIVGKLISPEDMALASYFRERVDVLSPDQKQVVNEFLNFLRRHHAEDFGEGELERAERTLQG
ncbi:MAG TPA: DUF6714 family protein [Thermoanaerobaculia bacterium]|nr:DUF6714 family protein [Thermoanaerobaculia bacterium]